ncbi:MAG: 5'-nucleotidase C-terminal domain-containing protein [Candidatus Accumulibacter sp.]|nr:5'-nucleotidase C-terminal domain-containing protein [Accumulibacter sp.]
MKRSLRSTLFSRRAFLLLCVPLLFACVGTADKDSNTIVTIAFTNDVHGHALHTQSGDLGLARFKTFAAEAGADLILDAGDYYHGLPFATMTSGESMAAVAKAVGYDAMTVGNHDWNYGPAQLKKLERLSGMPILTSNVIVKATGRPFFATPHVVKSLKHGLAVCVFGVVDPAIYRATAPARLEGLEYADPIATAQKAVTDLRAAGCGLIVALTHTHDRTQIAQNVAGVDLVIAGHEHVEEDKMVNGIHVLETGWATRSFWSVRLVWNRVGQCLTEVQVNTLDFDAAKTLAGNATVQAALDEVSAMLDPIMNEVIGTTPVDLVAEKIVVRSGETNMARVVTDAYLYATGAELAFENSGGVRDAEIKAGNITYGQVVGTAPFGNYLVVKELAGSAIRNILEDSLDIFLRAQKSIEENDSSLWPDTDGSSLQVGGMSYQYDKTLPRGERIQEILVNGQPLDADRIHTVAMSNFMAQNQDYPVIIAAETVGTFNACDEAIRDFIKDKGVEGSMEGVRMNARTKP